MEKYLNMEKLFNIAKSDFQMIGDTFVVALYLALAFVGFGLMIFFVGGLIVSLYEWIKEHFKK